MITVQIIFHLASYAKIRKNNFKYVTGRGANLHMYHVMFSKAGDFISTEEFEFVDNETVFYKMLTRNDVIIINVVAPNEKIARYRATKIMFL